MSEGRIALRLICYKRILESKNDQLRSEIDVLYISFIIISIKNSVFFFNKRANTNNNYVVHIAYFSHVLPSCWLQWRSSTIHWLLVWHTQWSEYHRIITCNLTNKVDDYAYRRETKSANYYGKLRQRLKSTTNLVNTEQRLH